MERINEFHVEKGLEESQRQKKRNRRGVKGSRTHCAQTPETETKILNCGNKTTPPSPNTGSPRPSLSSTSTPGKSSPFENPPSSQPRLPARWGPRPGCGRACSPAPQSPSLPRRRQSGKRKEGRDHRQAAPGNSRG